MRNKKKLIIIPIILVVVFFVAFYFLNISEDNNILKDIFKNNEQTEDVVVSPDNYNGIYVLEERLGMTITAYTGCTLSSVNNYIYVNGDEYRLFRSSCLGTFDRGSGNVDELEFSMDEKVNRYKITYKGKEYAKDLNLKNIVVVNNILERKFILRPDYYKFLLKETQFENNYFDFEADLTTRHSMQLISSGDGGFTVQIIDNSDRRNPKKLYSYYAKSIDELPEMTVMMSELAVLEKNNNGVRHSDRLLVIGDHSIVYNMHNFFPKTINGVDMDLSDNIFIKYNSGSNDYTMYLSVNDHFCVDGSESNDISYYIFEIRYDYYNNSYVDPIYKEFRTEKDGCKEITAILEE